MTTVRKIALAVGLPVVVVVIWWFASAGFYLPPLSKIVQTFPDTWFGPRMVDDVLPSLTRLAIDYLAALLLGVGLGMLIGTNRTLRAVVEPVLEFVRATPPPVLVPILMLLTGIGDTMKILVIISGCLWPILLNTVEGVRATDEVLTDACRSYRINGGLRLYQLTLRSASPQIVAGARQALTPTSTS
jgi:ABC-type nitrate/sulfonate/bicarbonate transport system permease component